MDDRVESIYTFTTRSVGPMVFSNNIDISEWKKTKIQNNLRWSTLLILSGYQDINIMFSRDISLVSVTLLTCSSYWSNDILQTDKPVGKWKQTTECQRKE